MNNTQAVARRMLEAIIAKDKDRILALFTDDAVFFDPHYPEATMRGKAAIAAGMDFAFGLLEQPGFTVLRTWQNNGSVVLETDTHHFLINGAEMRFPQVFVVDVQEGRVSRWQSFTPYPPPPPVG